MKINMTNYMMFEVLKILDKFANADRKLGYVIARAKFNMIDALRGFNQEREKLLEKYGELNEDGHYVVKEDSDKYIEFSKELANILDFTTEIEITQISPDEYMESNDYSPDASTKDYELIKGLFVKNENDFDNTVEK